MKAFGVAICAVILSGALAAEEGHSRGAVPQPRRRLDPTTRAAIPEPKKKRQESSDSVVTMSPFVVKSNAITANNPAVRKAV